MVCFLLQCKGFRILFDPIGVPLMFDVASVDVVLVSNAGGASGLADLQKLAGFRATVICSEATAVLCRLSGVHRVSMSQRVTVAKDVVVEGLSSGFSLGSFNWKLSLFGRVVSVLCESSLWPNRHPLPFDMELLEDCDLLVTAVARSALGDGNVSRIASELRTLMNSSPVAIPLASLTGPAMLDLLDMIRELQPPPSTLLVAREAQTVMASIAVLAEYFDSSRLSRVHNGDAPLALVPQLVTNLSLPIQARASNVFLTDNLAGLLSAVGSACVVVACDPSLATSSLPNGTRFWPVDTGLNAAQLRALCARVTTVQQLGLSSPFPVHVKLAVRSSQRCYLISQQQHGLKGSRLRVMLDGRRDEVLIGPAGAPAPTAEQMAWALRRAGIVLVKLTRTSQEEFVMTLPTLENARIEVNARETRLVAESGKALDVLCAVLRDCNNNNN